MGAAVSPPLPPLAAGPNPPACWVGSPDYALRFFVCLVCSSDWFYRSSILRTLDAGVVPKIRQRVALPRQLLRRQLMDLLKVGKAACSLLCDVSVMSLG